LFRIQKKLPNPASSEPIQTTSNPFDTIENSIPSGLASGFPNSFGESVLQNVESDGNLHLLQPYYILGRSEALPAVTNFSHPEYGNDSLEYYSSMSDSYQVNAPILR
jgi:hypothetical protein